VLPPVLQSAFTVDQARAVGLHRRALHRLIRARLASRVDGGHYRIVAPIDEARLALAGLGPDAALSCQSVAAFLDWPLPEPPVAVHVTVPRTSTRKRWPGAEVHSRRLADDETCRFQGIRMTIPEVAAIDLAAVLPLKDAVVLLDAGLRKGNLSTKALRKRLVRRRRVPGNTKAARAVRLSDRRRQSPLESEFRVLVFDAGLPVPAEQLEVRADGVFLGRADFGWPEHRLLVEIDGWEFHRLWEAFVKDRRRQNAFVLDGWRVLRFTAADLRSRPHEVVEELRRALGVA
jgi:very-short-patch-repair endonuclease